MPYFAGVRLVGLLDGFGIYAAARVGAVVKNGLAEVVHQVEVATGGERLGKDPFARDVVVAVFQSPRIRREPPQYVYPDTLLDAIYRTSYLRDMRSQVDMVRSIGKH